MSCELIDYETASKTLSHFCDTLASSRMLSLLFESFSLIGAVSGQNETTMQKFPNLIAKISRGRNQRFLETMVTLHLSDLTAPQLIFRSDGLATRTLRELTQYTIGSDLIKHLSPCVAGWSASKFSARQISSKTIKFLKCLYAFPFSTEFQMICSVVRSCIDKKFPGSSRCGLSSLLFLRYLSPLLVSSAEKFHVEPNQHYRENSLKIAKALQVLANGAEPTSDLLDVVGERIFAPKHQKLLNDFFDRLSLAHSPDIDIPPVHIRRPSNEDIAAFSQIVLTCSLRIRLILKKSIEDAPLLADWMDLTTQLSKINSPDKLEPSGPSIPTPRSHSAGLKSRKDSSNSLRSRSSIFPPLLRSRTATDSLSIPVEHSSSEASRRPLPHSLSIDLQSFLPTYSSSSASPCPSSTSSSSDDQEADGLKYEPLGIHAPLGIRSVCPSQEEIESWGPQQVERWLVVNDLGELIPHFKSVDGKVLLHPSFTLPPVVKLGTRKCFTRALDQLKRLSKDLFDSSLFDSPELQILALKEALQKVSFHIASS